MDVEGGYPEMDRYGIECQRCGCVRTNVMHHTPAERADPKNPHSWPLKEQDGKDYYTWAKVPFHEFVTDDIEHHYGPVAARSQG